MTRLILKDQKRDTLLSTHLKKCCALRSIWRTTVSSFYLHKHKTDTHTYLSLALGEAGFCVKIWMDLSWWWGHQGCKPCSGPGSPFTGCLWKCWGKTPKIHTQPPIFTVPYFASSFLTHLRSFLLTLPFVLCLFIESDILQTLSLPSTHWSLMQPWEEDFLWWKKRILKEVDRCV